MEDEEDPEATQPVQPMETQDDDPPADDASPSGNDGAEDENVSLTLSVNDE
jgi:hypothetical protein